MISVPSWVKTPLFIEFLGKVTAVSAETIVGISDRYQDSYLRLIGVVRIMYGALGPILLKSVAPDSIHRTRHSFSCANRRNPVHLDSSL